MCQVAIRSKFEQSEHDLVVGQSADTYRSTGRTAYSNPGTKKNRDIDGLYPDILATERDGLKVIEEIETGNTVTEDECESQWKPYSELAYLFKLIVPLSKMGLAQKHIRHSQLSVVLQGYEIRYSRSGLGQNIFIDIIYF